MLFVRPAVEENGTNAQAGIVDEEDMPVPFRYIGQAFSTYIILEYDSDRLMFIDKHAAHERLLYERLKAGSDGKAAQYLLEPVAVSMDAEECRIVLENKDALLGAGFEVDAFGDKTILVRSVPVFMDKLEVSREFSEIADYLCRHKKVIISEKMDWIIANTACRAAIKAGNVSTDDELIELALELAPVHEGSLALARRQEASTRQLINGATHRHTTYVVHLRKLGL